MQRFIEYLIGISLVVGAAVAVSLPMFLIK